MSLRPRATDDVWGILGLSLGLFGLALVLLDERALALVLIGIGLMMLYQAFTTR